MAGAEHCKSTQLVPPALHMTQPGVQDAAAMNVGRTVHPAFQRKAMPASNPDAKPRTAPPPEFPAEPALPPLHITQVQNKSVSTRGCIPFC